ncbi:homeobox protein OTX1-like [Mizuhopecten yessoensis]|uniref:Homeobox protein ESX1 n=1 Tax=Mizuhopecten yessoensis TaxID=6573 RepID=A0A210QFA5_MIZYE|nr:homeobox protein OTX1-like [Mizuhopecten yessoensis]OWF47443.1 Homeobox protein ESX1 [Mizuhopecten yessoensis]
MLEVDSYRRTLHSTGYDPRIPMPEMPDFGGLHEPFAYHALSAVNKPEKQNSLIHWSPPPATTVSPTPATGAKSDEEDDEDDDDCRPFTPPPPRERLSYTRYQLEMLNSIYIRVRYPNSTQKLLIAKRVGITREQVKIWFQNRRRKDVIGKKKDGSESDCSKSDHSDTRSDHGDNRSDHGDSKGDNCDSDSGVSEENGGLMVPEVVMKSVIAELHKFEKEPIKSKKLKKKMKASRKKAKKAVTTQQFQSMLLGSGYDMISPPNQVIAPAPPKVSRATKFNHSKDMSAFDAPKEGMRPVSYMDGYGNSLAGSLMSSVPMRDLPAGHSSVNASLGCDMPVLSDLLNYTKTSSADTPTSRTHEHLQRVSESSMMHHHQNQTSPTSGFYPSVRTVHVDSLGQPSMPMSSAVLSRVYPYPFIAEHPMVLSTLRHNMEPFRPQPQYPGGHHYNEDYSPFQPYNITSLANPYYSQTSPWSQHNSSAESNGPFQQL